MPATNVITAKRDPQEEEDDEVWDGEEPLHQPQPTAQRLVERGRQPNRRPTCDRLRFDPPR